MKILQSKSFLSFLTLVIGLLIWLYPAPEGLKPEAWKLFAIFFTTILSIILNVLPIFVASIIALSFTVLSGVLKPSEAYSGFGESFILLIVVAFLVSRAVVKSGLGKRIAMILISKFGKSTLGLGYSMFATDILIAAAFPSNTARSGVLYPIVNSLAHDSGSKVADGTRKKMGAFLMMNSMAGLSISSALWFTAMASNPVGAGIAEKMGIHITFGSWFIAALVPSLVAFILIPRLLYKVFPPEVKDTPNAPIMAKEALVKMGKMSKNEYITAITFLSMVTLWSLSGLFPIDKTAVAFGGLGILMISKIFTIDDLKEQGEALNTLIWFATLYTLSTYLNKFGFMNYVGDNIAQSLLGFSWFSVYILLIVSYVLIHYLFVSQTAQMLALYGVFLSVGIEAGVPPEMMALMLLFATNFNSIITPQGSSANVIFVSSEYLSAGEIYKNGGIVTLANTIIFLSVGTLWMMVLGIG